MPKHAHASQKWAYSAEQMAKVMDNSTSSKYKRGLLDALRAVARLEAGDITVEQLQFLLDELPNAWDQTFESAYVRGFEDMYGLLAESLSTEYAPETEKAAEMATKTRPEAKIQAPEPPRPPVALTSRFFSSPGRELFKH